MRKIIINGILVLLAFTLCACSSSQAVSFSDRQQDFEKTLRLQAADATFPLFEDVADDTAAGRAFSIVSLPQEPPRRSVIGFAVRSDGAIAVLQERRTEYRNKIVVVYDAEGHFQYGLSFHDPGASGVDFDADVLRIWSVRGDCVITVDEQGNVLHERNALDANAFDTYWSEEVDAREHFIGNSVYRADNAGWFAEAFANDFGRISVNENGKTRVLYLADTRPVFQTYGVILGGVIFAPTVVIVILVHVVREAKRKRN